MPDDFRLTDFPYCHTQEPTPWKIDPYWMAIDALQYGDTSLLDSLLLNGAAIPPKVGAILVAALSGDPALPFRLELINNRKAGKSKPGPWPQPDLVLRDLLLALEVADRMKAMKQALQHADSLKSSRRRDTKTFSKNIYNDAVEAVAKNRELVAKDRLVGISTVKAAYARFRHVIKDDALTAELLERYRALAKGRRRAKDLKEQCPPCPKIEPWMLRGDTDEAACESGEIAIHLD